MNIPRLHFAHLPTPIEPLPRLSAALDGPRLFIKRDDQTGLALGGNKTRKLEFLVAEALAQGARTLVTAGAWQSNHCRQTAAAAARFGLACTLVMAGDAPREATGNVLLDHLLGASIVPVADRADRDRVLQETCTALAAQGRAPYLIPVGGSNPTGALGYCFALGEALSQTPSQTQTQTQAQPQPEAQAQDQAQPQPQAQAQDQAQDPDRAGIPGWVQVPPEPQSRPHSLASPEGQGLDKGETFDWMVFCTSSGGTHAGLVLGQRVFGYRGQVLGISNDHPAACVQREVAALASAASEKLGPRIDFTPADVLVNDDYCAAGYGVLTDAEREAIRLFARHEGILLDPVYTGRAAVGLVDMIRRGMFDKRARVLFWHTGGQAALFAADYQNFLYDKFLK